MTRVLSITATALAFGFIAYCLIVKDAGKVRYGCTKLGGNCEEILK